MAPLPASSQTAATRAPVRQNPGSLYVTVKGDFALVDQLYDQIDNGHLRAWQVSSLALTLEAKSTITLFIDNASTAQHLHILVNGALDRLKLVRNSQGRGLKASIVGQ